MNNPFRILFATLAGVALAAAAGTAGAAQRWDMPVAYAATNYHTVNDEHFAQAITQATNGAIKVVVHPSGSLFKGNEIKRAVQTGQAQVGERLISALANENPLFEVDALPFLATSFDQAWDLYQASKPALEQVLAKQNLKLLYAVPWPPQGLYTKKPVTSAADMKNVKFRAYNSATARLAELMGAIPTQIEAADLDQAFATGVVDSMISSGSTGYDRKIWQYTNYWYDVQAWLPKNMVFINKHVWDGLDPKTQGIILGASAMAEKAGWAKARELADWYKKQLAAHGMKVEPPSKQLKSDFEKIGRTMTADWLKRAGPEGKKIIDKYRAMEKQ